jgi:hypothetical protein
MGRGATRLAAGVFALALLASCSGSSSDDALTTPDALLDWIDTHRDNVGLVAFRTSSPHKRIALNDGQVFPLASAIKVLILLAYADAVEAGTIRRSDPFPLDAVERWYWPGTDGGAHEEARRDRLGPTPSVDDVLWSMMRWSDNAATDALLERVGGPSVVMAAAARRGLIAQEPIGSIFGMFVSWSQDPQWEQRTPADRSARSMAAAAATTREQAVQLRLPLERQVTLSRVAPGGTPREWAALMARLYVDAAKPTPSGATIRAALEWPMTLGNDKAFSRFGAKGGSLRGVITEVTYLEPNGRPAVAAALFFRNLPPDMERQLGETFVQQDFLVRLAKDQSFFDEVRSRLR